MAGVYQAAILQGIPSLDQTPNDRALGETGLSLWFPVTVKLPKTLEMGASPRAQSQCAERQCRNRKALTCRGSAQGILVLTAERSQSLMFTVWLLSAIVKAGESL